MLTKQQLDAFGDDLGLLLEKHGFVGCLFSIAVKASPKKVGWTPFRAVAKNVDSIQAAVKYMGRKLTDYLVTIAPEVNAEADAADRRN